MLSAKPWRGEAVTQFCAAQLVCFCLGVAMVSLLQKAGFTAFKSPDGFGTVLLGTLSFQGATWVLIYFFLRHHQVRWHEIFGLRESRLPRALLTALFTVLVILPVRGGCNTLRCSCWKKSVSRPKKKPPSCCWRARNRGGPAFIWVFRRHDRAGGRGIYFSGRAVSIRQTARLSAFCVARR